MPTLKKLSVKKWLLGICLFYSVYFLILPLTTFAQQKGFNQENITGSQEDTLFEEADYHFIEKNYLRALELFKMLDERFPGRILYKYRLGVCMLYKNDEIEKALQLLEEVDKENPKFEEVGFFIARAYHLNYQFDKCLERLDALRKQKKIYKTRKSEIVRLTEWCNNARQMVEKPAEVTIKNLGGPINAASSEYVPVITSDESMMILTYKGDRSTGGRMNKYGNPDPNGEYFEDIFVSYKLGEAWLMPESIGENINTQKHDAAIALSSDGQKLFLYKDTEGSSGDIYVSYLEGEIWGFPLELNENVNSKSWEGSASISPDEKTLYFVSERKGGVGGRDIYISKKQEDGTWGKAENIGPGVNTKYNEDAPFIHPDGTTLFFSSEGYNTIGGYDIYKTTWQETGKWSKPENLGFPVNTPDDDKYYVEAANGQRAYYSSGKVGGYGGQDIYVIHWGVKEKAPAVALIKGTVTVDDRPVKSAIAVNDMTQNVVQGAYNSNASTGKYLVNLPTGKNYKMVFSVEGFDVQEREVNLADKDTFTEITMDIALYNSGYVPGSVFSIRGRMYYGDTANPAKDINLTVSGEDKKPVAKTVTGDAGKFTFAQLPSLDKYFITADENDPDFIPGKNHSIEGYIYRRDSAAKGVAVNSIITDSLGFFRLNFFDFDTLPANLNKIESMNFNDPALYLELLKKYGNARAEGMVFNVQIAAYYDASKFITSHIKGLGELKIKKLEDGITRFSLGDYQTLNEAEMLRQQAVAKGVNDAFVTVFYKGERKIWVEMVRNNFYQPR